MTPVSFGAVPEGKGVRFTTMVANPASSVPRSVELVIHSGKGAGIHHLHPSGKEVYDLWVAGVAPGDRYRYRLDRGELRPDPASRFQPEGVHGPSEVVDALRYHWRDAGWKGRPPTDLVVYELHVGTF